MPDITMCKGGNCPAKEQCYRYRATPSTYRQSYFAEPPHVVYGCQYFMPMSEAAKHDGTDP